jgi:S1-C subfamily serine protease
MASHFLTKTVVPEGALIRVGDAAAIERFEALERALSAVGDGAGAGLFAQPVLGGAAQQGVTVAWYARRSGTGRRLTELDDDARAAAEEALRRRLAAVAPALRDAEAGPLVGAALLILDLSDVHVVDGEPVLVNWGAAPPPAATDAAARSAHFARTLGQYLALDAAPPISTAEWRARGGAPAQAAATAAAVASVASAAPARAAAAPQAPLPAPEPGGDAPASGRWRWIPLLALLGLSLAALVWLLLPGTRLFPEPPPPRLVADGEAERILAEVNGTLEQRARALREAVEGAVCTAEGALVLPDGRTIEGLAPPAAGDGPASPRVGSPSALVPPDPGRVQVPRPSADPAAQPETATLLQAIEDQTAIVIAVGAEASGTGSGFFVGPDLLVTNHHVVAAAAGGGRLMVANRRLGRVRDAELLASFGPLEEVGGDFALLRVPGVDMPFYALRASLETMKLQNVIAAGYPGAILETDANFARLREGDMTAIPDLSVTDGIVNTEQDLGPATRAMIHTAVISPGNSGGPLVDGCGRAVGVNTFGRTSDQRHLNFALASTDLLRFLEGAGVTARTDAGGCAPSVRPAAPPPPAAAGGGAAAPAPAGQP